MVISTGYYILISFAIGFIGSIAYFTALYFKFIGGHPRNHKIIISPFMKNNSKSSISSFKVVSYCSIGGFIAVIFQLPQLTAFAPIQSFILGSTWPSIVTQLLSGRMYEASKEEKDDWDKTVETMEKRTDLNRWKMKRNYNKEIENILKKRRDEK